MGQEQFDTLLAKPENEKSIRRAWERLRVSNEIAEDVRAPILHSWGRCSNSGVDPSLKHARMPLGVEQLAELFSLNSQIIEASDQTIKIARELLAGSGAAMMLTDAKGVILTIEGDVRVLDVLGGLNMLPGACWTEEHCGTNAIGTAISLARPIQIHGSEHFCEVIQRFTCSASTIHDPATGDIVGVLNVSGFADSYTPQTLALVVNAADRIKGLLEHRLLRMRHKMLEFCSGKLSMSDSETSVLLDYRGMPIQVGEKVGAKLAALGLSAELFQSPLLDSHQGPQRTPSPSIIKTDWVESVYDHEHYLGSIIRFPPDNPTNRQKHCEVDKISLEAFGKARGESTSFRKAINKACHIAKSCTPVLLLGETGVGKEIFAKGIHRVAANERAPFIALNCGALSRELLASELFGYVDGAFTGARRGGMRGKIEAANGGTLFLDEIGEMPLEHQPSFLRVLEEREVVRLGETQAKKVSFRLICATNRDLKKEIAAGRFRADLYYRISVARIKIPALRERTSDIRILARHFLESITKGDGTSNLAFSNKALEGLEAYSWPGNIRELRNVVENLVLSSSGPIIGHEEVEAELRGESDDDTAFDTRAVGGTLARSEFEHIKRILQQTEGNATRAAKQLGIAKSTLYLKIKSLGLSDFLLDQRTS